MKWTLLTGSWGDVFAGYGNLCRLYGYEEKVNVVYFGLDPDVCTFLKAQPNIGEVKHLLISEPAAFFKYNRLAATDFPEFMEVTGLKESVPDMSVPCHISNHYLERNPEDCNRFYNCDMPVCPADWWMFLSRKRPFVLFQPFSVRSVSFDQHWPHWIEALNWVLEHTQINVVLAGELRSPFDTNFVFPWVEHERLINIVGQTKSMLDVLHIATWAEKIITTSNALAMWSIVQTKPALVVCHKLIKERAPYYYNWIKAGPNTVLDADVDLEGFKQTCAKWAN